MSYSDIIYVSLLGGCCLSYRDKSISRKNVHSKRIWTLLEYLIIYRSRTVTQNELFELLYEKSEKPLSALKTLVYRARSLLNELEYTDGKHIILQCSGGYAWNPDIPLDVDVDNFESVIREAAALDNDKDAQLNLRLKALELYKGDFLPNSEFEAWVVPIAAYYRYLFMDTVDSALKELYKQNRYSDVISVAQRAIAFDPYEERLYYYLILALANTNQIVASKAQYENMTKLFYSEFGVTPSSELQALYKKLSSSDNGVENSLSIIKSNMKEEGGGQGAFCCEYEFFKDIYRLEVRSAARKGIQIHICLLSISGKDGGSLPKKTQATVMNKLSDCIQGSLRRGDVYSRYSVSQYVILLPQANYQNSTMILERIVRKFRQDNSHSPALITYNLQAIDTDV